MINTWIAASIVAVIAGLVGFFVVIRGQAFPAHALPNSAFAGAAAANLMGLNPLLGLSVFAALSALAMSYLGRRGRHDVVTALALVLGLALGAVFLSRSGEYEPELFALLFGEVLGVSSVDILPVALLAAGCAFAVIALYRPLLYSSIVPEIAGARGLRLYWLDLVFLLILAAATALTVPVVGALLIFSLMIGPPAAARSLTKRPSVAISLSVIVALVTVWTAIASSHVTNWPIGFFVGCYAALSYGAGRSWASWRRGSLFARAQAD